MFDLRPYQVESKLGVRQSFKNGLKRVILCKPTGAGKTVTFADIVREAVSKGSKAMILCDRKELISQAYNKVAPLGLSPTIIAPGHAQYSNNLYLASVDTLRRRELPKIDLLIVDEAHKQTFDSTIQRYIDFCDPYIIGATATPLRTGSQTPLDDFYQAMIEPVTTSDLLDLSFLVPAKTFAARADFSGVKKRGAEFDVGELFKKFNDSVLYDGVVENYLKFAAGKKAICFNVNVQHSKNMVERFLQEGITAEHVDGKTPTRERKDIFKRFELGITQILCNCDVATTGFDEPSVECVIVNRATMSLILWLQMCGRGSRLYGGKENFIIIDQGANVYRHGMWEDEREWSLAKKPKRKGDGVTPVKLCEGCGIINHASARVCKECGQPFEIKKKALKVAEFIEVKRTDLRGAKKRIDVKNMTQAELEAHAKAKGYKRGWVKYQLSTRV